MRKNYDFTSEGEGEEEEIVFILGTNFLSFPPSGRVISSLVQGMGKLG